MITNIQVQLKQSDYKRRMQKNTVNIYTVNQNNSFEGCQDNHT